MFAEPDRFDPMRDGPGAISFAYGAHFCVGASLARTEVEIMLRTVARRWPALRLAAGKGLRWHQREPFRGLDELVVAA